MSLNKKTNKGPSYLFKRFFENSEQTFVKQPLKPFVSPLN